MIGQIAASVGGSAIDSLNDYLTRQKQDQILKLILERRARQQEELDAMLMGEVGTLRGETPEAERATAMNQFVGQLRDARAAQPSSYGTRGTMSDREVAAMGELTGDLGKFAGREADITSRLDAPGRMREKQGLRLGRTGTQMQEQVHKIGSSDFIDQLRLSRVRKNPWLSMLSSGLKGAGAAMGAGGGAGGGSGYSMNASQFSDLLNRGP